MDFIKNITKDGEVKKKKKKIKKNKPETQIPIVSEYDSTKIFLNKDFIKAFLKHDLEFFIKNKNFQRNYMKKLPKLLWTYEKDYNIGDFNLLFLNPDSEEFEDNEISSEDALGLFFKLTETSYDFFLKEKFLKVLRQAFTECFLELPDKKKEKKSKFSGNIFNNIIQAAVGEKKKKDKVELSKRNFETMPLNNREHGEDEQIERLEVRDSVNVGKEAPKDTQPNENPEAKDNEINRLVNDDGLGLKKIDNADDLVALLEANKQPVDKENTTKPEAKENEPQQDNTNVKLQVPDDKKIEYENTRKKSLAESKVDETAYGEKTKKQSEDSKKNKDEIYKPLGNGKFFKQSEDGTFIRTQSETGDFMTLIRQLIYVMLGYHGIVVREFITSDGKFIVAVCYSHIDNLKTIAEIMRMSKKVDIAITDLLSLEPIDSRNRPLRMNEVLWSKKKWTEVYGKGKKESDLFDELNLALGNNKEFANMIKGEREASIMSTEHERLKSKIKATYENNFIDFHNLVRKCKGLLDKIDHMKEDYVNDIIDHDKVPLSTWKNYYQFLNILGERILRIDEKHNKLKERLKRKYLNFKVQEINNPLEKALDQIIPGNQKNLLPKNYTKILRKHITGNKSTYKLKVYKLSKQLGVAYSVS